MWQTCEKMTDYCSGRPWGMERRKVGVESWSPPVDVCGILRRTAVSSASNNNSSDQSSCQMELSVRPSQTDAASQPSAFTLHYPSPPDLVSLPTPHPYATRVVCICRQAAPLRGSGPWSGPSASRQLFQPRKRNTCAVVSSASHRPTDRRTDGRMEDEGDRYTQLVPWKLAYIRFFS